MGNPTVAMNLQELATSICSNGDVFGEGETANVFWYGAFDDESKQSKHHEAAKITMVGEDQTSDTSFTQQTNLANQVQTMNILNKLDNQSLYFPVLYFCAEATTDFSKSASGQSSNEKYLKPNKNEIPFVISMEPMDTPLSYINVEVLNHKLPPISIDQRVQMAINLLRGLALMNQVVIHCDIYEENIMLNILNTKASEQVTQNGLRVIDYMGKYYQTKIIDFGDSLVIEAVQNLICKTGRMGFAPQEFFETDVTHEKFDHYSMGMALLDQEIRSGHNLPLNQIFEIINTIKLYNVQNPQKILDKFSKSQINDLKTHGVIKDLTKMMESEAFAEQIKADVVQIVPNAVDLAMEGAAMNLDWSVDEASEFMYNSVVLFAGLVKVSLRYYTQTEEFLFEYKAKLAQMVKREGQIPKKILEYKDKDQTKHSQYVNMKTQNEYGLQVIRAEIELKKNVFNILQGLLESKDNRADPAAVMNQLMVLLKDFKETNLEQLAGLEENKLVVLRKTVEGRGQAEQETVEEYANGRAYRQPTLYRQQHTQYFRRRRLLV